MSVYGLVVERIPSKDETGVRFPLRAYLYFFLKKYKRKRYVMLYVICHI